jgi:hypothetical protein
MNHNVVIDCYGTAKIQILFGDTYSQLKRKQDPFVPALYSQPDGSMPRREPKQILHM